ncbi:ICAM5 protein, partial [Tachuris rubrigastra]|nr:ICAM5 protein [Tachuris rubrigastra]
AVPPWLDDVGCPLEQNWTEGQEETLRCLAQGNPRPLVSCARDGQSFPAGISHPITRRHAGTYHCWATNELGTDERSITVWVHCERGHPQGGRSGVLLAWGSLRGVW